MLRLVSRIRVRHLEAALELTRATAALRLTPQHRTVGLLGQVHAGQDRDVPAEQLAEAVIVGRAVAQVAARVPWRPTCLRQALAAQRMLRRRGIPGRIHLGVRGASEPAAHAWVTVGGCSIVGGSGVERYVPLAALR